MAGSWVTDGATDERFTLVRNNGNRRIVHRQYNATVDGTERRLTELVLTRAARPAAPPR